MVFSCDEGTRLEPRTAAFYSWLCHRLLCDARQDRRNSYRWSSTTESVALWKTKTGGALFLIVPQVSVHHHKKQCKASRPFPCTALTIRSHKQTWGWREGNGSSLITSPNQKFSNWFTPIWFHSASSIRGGFLTAPFLGPGLGLGSLSWDPTSSPLLISVCKSLFSFVTRLMSSDQVIL